MWPFKTKIVEVEKIVERLVIGPPTLIDVYEAYEPGDSENPYMAYLMAYRPRESFGYFYSCADAYAVSDSTSLKVVREEAIVVDGEHFIFSHRQPIKVQKPKVSKGKK
jgi:hypothetical protein